MSAATARPPASSTSSAVVDADDVPDEAPPAYTPAADAWQGEQVVEAGPSRPFQPAPYIPPPRPPPSEHPPWQSPHHTGMSQSSWHSAPHQQPDTFDVGIGRPGVGLGSPFPPIGPFPPPQNSHSPPMDRPASFSPPPGPPPSHPSLSPTPPTRRKPVYEPTQIPVPGQALLNAGNLLVFPVNHVPCPKCSDTGYKQFDPTHPCRQCWKRFGKQYTSALRHSLSLSDENAPFPPPHVQRPLPERPPPQARPSHNFFPGAPGAYGSPPPPMHPMGPPPRIVSPPMGMAFAGPPPGALIVRPGDPRIGGELCLKCGGDGYVTTFMLDSETCSRCQGSGRVFR